MSFEFHFKGTVSQEFCSYVTVVLLMCCINLKHLCKVPLICYYRKKTTFVEVKWITSSIKIRYNKKKKENRKKIKICMHVIICISEFACMRPRISMLAYQLRLLHCPRCPVAESGTKIPPAFTTRKHARQKGKSSACVT